MTAVGKFVGQLKGVRFANVFNPYRDHCPAHDLPYACKIRRRNLSKVLTAAMSSGVDVIWLGRDLGYRGGRRTGLALTDESCLPNAATTYGVPVNIATRTGPVSERTAQQIWAQVGLAPTVPILWNVFPFHPHEPGNSMSNRRHTRQEFDLCSDILTSILQLLRPKFLVAIGQDAHAELLRQGRKSILVRHPSYGGHIEFATGIRRFYSSLRRFHAGAVIKRRQ